MKCEIWVSFGLRILTHFNSLIIEAKESKISRKKGLMMCKWVTDGLKKIK